MRRLLLISVAIVFAFSTYGQQEQSQCAQTLRLAQSTYEQGHLREIADLLKSCLSGNELTSDQKVTGYRLLTLAAIYLEEPDEADKQMINLLRTDHFFKPNLAVDPAEFIALYGTFRTSPLFELGIKLGPDATFPALKKNYYVGANAVGNGKYSPKANFQVGLVFEKALSTNPAKKILSRITGAPELLYNNLAFDYTNSSITVNNQTGNSQSHGTGTYNLTRVDLNLLAHYQLNKSSTFSTYAGLGPGIGYLLSSSAQLETLNEDGSVVTGASIDMLDTYRKINISVLATAGARYKFGDFYITADVAIGYGLMNVVDADHRSNPEAVFDYGLGPQNDYSINQVAAHIGFSYPIFKPKKK